MLNTGNSSNLAKLAKDIKIEPNDVMAWVHQHASKKDREFVQGIWDMFADIKKKSDTMYRSLTGGVAPKASDPTGGYATRSVQGWVLSGNLSFLKWKGTSKLMGKTHLSRELCPRDNSSRVYQNPNGLCCADGT